MSRSFTLVLAAALSVSACGTSSTPEPAAAAPQAGEIPAFEYDPTWPKLPLPNNWITGNIAGVHVDEKDQIWVLQRGNTVPLDLGDDYAAMDPPAGDCCKPAPSVMVFDLAGNVVKAWGGQDMVKAEKPVKAQAGFHWKTKDGYDWPREHGIFVDHKGNVWLGCDEGVSDRVEAPEN